MPELLAGASPAGGGDIECVTIDSLDLARCAFLKLDVEGHEARALAGARQTLARCAPWVLIENKPARREGRPGGGAAERMLADCGYELVEKIGADEIDWLFRPGEANDRTA